MYYVTMNYSLFMITRIILPTIGMLQVISIFLRPKDDGLGLMVLHLQFLVFGIIGEIFKVNLKNIT